MRDYSFELRPFYALAFDQCAARIEVRGGVVKQVTRLGSLEPTVMTIDDLFRHIHDAAASGEYETIQANYDSDLGYPTRIVFRTIPEIMDGTRSSRSRHSGGSTDPERRARREPRDHRGRKTRGDAMTDRPSRLLG